MVPDHYAVFKFKKSTKSYEYHRRLTKVDEAASYIGGLIGVLMGLLFIVSPYTELCYELSLANQLLADKDQKPVKTAMNFLRFIAYNVYRAFKNCCSWEESNQYALYEECSDSIQKQLDIGCLLKRVTALEQAVIPFIPTDLHFVRRSFR